MNSICAVEQDLRRRDRQEDALDALDAKADRIGAELMQPGAEFWPFSFENFDTALFELGQSGKTLAAVESALARFAHGDWKPLHTIIHNYFAAKADAKAEVMAAAPNDDFDVPDRYDD